MNGFSSSLFHIKFLICIICVLCNSVSSEYFNKNALWDYIKCIGKIQIHETNTVTIFKSGLKKHFKKFKKTVFLTCLLVLCKSSLSETHCKWELKSVYCLDEEELNFFILAHKVLCFGFLTKAVLIAHKYFSYCWTVFAWHWDLLDFSCSPPASRLGLGKRLWEAELGQLNQRDIPCYNKNWGDVFPK